MRQTFRNVWWLGALLAIGLIGGCPSTAHSPAKKPKDAGQMLETDSGLSVYCPDGSPDSSTFGIHTKQSGQHITAELMNETPNPPAQQNNTWVLAFTDADGNPLDDMTITSAAAKMPFHSHPPRYATSMTKMPEPGQFKVGLFLTMPGYFEIQFNVSSPSAGDDTIVFDYCLR